MFATLSMVVEVVVDTFAEYFVIGFAGAASFAVKLQETAAFDVGVDTAD